VKPSVKNILMNRYGILLLSVLMFLLSVIFNKKLNRASAVEREKRLAENYIHKQQNDFEKFLKDTAFVNALLSNDETLKDVTGFPKRHTVYFFTETTDWGRKNLHSGMDKKHFLRPN
jgi:hypothetical protein